MPNVRMPNGMVIRDVPAGVTKEILLAKLEKKGFDRNTLLAPKVEKNLLEKIPIVGEAVAGAADLPLKAFQGATGVAKTLTDIAGAGNVVSRGLETASDYAGDITSSGSKLGAQEGARIMKEAEGKSAWEQAKAAGRAFAQSPLDYTAQGIGSAVPFVLAAIGSEGMAVPAMLGAASGAGMIKGDIYDAVKQEFGKAPGMTPEKLEEIATKAQEYGGDNTDMIALGGVIGAIASSTGVTRDVAGAFARRAAAKAISGEAAEVAAEQVAGKGLVRRIAGGMAEEGIPEGIQAGHERVSQNKALQRLGVNVDTYKGAAGQAVLEGIMGGVLGGMTGPLHGGGSAAAAADPLSDPRAQALTHAIENPTEEGKNEAISRLVELGIPAEFAAKAVDATLARNQELQDGPGEAAAETVPPPTVAGAEEEVAPPAPPTPEAESFAPPVEEFNADQYRKGELEELLGSPDDIAEMAHAENVPFKEMHARLLEEHDRLSQATAPPVVPPSVIPPAATITPQAHLDTQLTQTPVGQAVQQDQAAQQQVAEAAPVKAPPVITPEFASRVLEDDDLEAINALAEQYGETEDSIRSGLQEIAEEGGGARFARPKKPSGKYIPPSFDFEAAPVEAAPVQEAPQLSPEEAPVEEIPPEQQMEEQLSLLGEQGMGSSPQAIAIRRERKAMRDRNKAMAAKQPFLMEGARNVSPEEEAAAQEAIAAQQELSAQKHEQKLGEIEQYIHNAHPENKNYTVVHQPGTAAPYRVLGPNGETYINATNMVDFEDQVGDLEVYHPELANRDKSAGEPTASTQMVQELTDTIDWAREKGLIDNLERSELFRMLQRPEAGRKDKAGIPTDPILLGEYLVRNAERKVRNAKTDAARKGAEAELELLSNDLRKLTHNKVSKPILAKLQAMADSRVSELKDARLDQENATLQEALGKMQGADVSEETRKKRESKISVLEGKAPRFKTGATSSVGMGKGQVDEIVAAITKGWKGTSPFKVYQSFNDLPLRVAMAIGDANANAFGVTMPDGSIYLIADNLTSTKDTRAVIFHEALGHLGLSKEFGEKLDALLMSMHAGNPALQAETKAWMENPVNAETYAHLGKRQQLIRAIEEVLAERAEEGRISVPMMQRLTALVREFVRKMAAKLSGMGPTWVRNYTQNLAETYSDADITAILARAHDAMVQGKGGGTATDAKFKRNKTNPKTASQLVEEGDTANVGLRKINTSQNTYEMGGGFFDWFKAHDSGGIVQGIKDNFKSSTTPVLSQLLKVLPTSGILDWKADMLPTLNTVAREVAQMHNMSKNILKGSDKLARKIDEFTKRTGEAGEKALARAQQIARINEVSPTDHATEADAMKNNKALKGIEDMILKESNDKAKVKAALDTIRKEVSEGRENSTEITRAKAALHNNAMDPKKVDRLARQFETHAGNVHYTMMVWEELGKHQGGQQLYKDVRQYYHDMYEVELGMLDKRMEDMTDEKGAQRLSELRAEMMKKAVEPTAEQKASDPFWDLPVEWFPKDYFPFMREGQFWLRVKGETKRGKQVRAPAFYTFENAAERDRVRSKLAKEFGADPQDNEVFAKGNTLEELGGDLKTEDAMMQKVFEELAKFRNQTSLGKADVNDIIDSIYQAWLMSSPERSIRRRFMHSQEVTGFSSNTLLHFQKQASSYANQLSKLAYASKLQGHFKQMKEDINKEQNVDDRADLAAVLAEMEKRVDGELNPKDQSAFVNALNRMSFIYFLTGGATALTQLTSIPIRTIPRLWRDFGYAEGTRLGIKYARMWKTVGFPKAGETEDGFLNKIMPSIGNSKMVRGNALLSKAYAAADKLNILDTAATTMVENERSVPTAKRGVRNTAANVGKGVTDWMGFMFTASENISRQMAYLMAFEAKHKELAKKNPGDADGNFQKAVDYGVKIVTDTLGDYSSFEKPSALKGNFMRAATLFKAYPIAQTKWMFGAMKALAKPASKEEWVATFKEFSGVMMMAGMFGGMAGLPLYSLMTFLLAQMIDDDDLKGHDPRLARDPDMAFRKWLNEQGGPAQMRGADGRMHRLGDMIANGPISELTDINVGSRTSLDLKNMWYRDSVKGDKWGDGLLKAIVSNIAGGSMAVSMANGVQDIADGETEAGLKKMLPAHLRGLIDYETMQREGVVNKKGDTVMSKEDFNGLNAAMAVLGFRSQRLSMLQDVTITRAANDKRIKGERTKLMQQYDKMVHEGAPKSEVQAFLRNDIRDFNKRYPHPDFIIKRSALRQSLKTSLKNRGRTEQGIRYTKKGGARDRKDIESLLPV